MQEPTSDWLKHIQPDKLMGDAQRIMKTAVDVLEEEIAAGILAAKKLEKKVLEKDGAPETDPDDLMNRVRNDMHNAVDLIMDSVTALRGHFGTLADKLTKTAAPAEAAATPPAADPLHVPIIRNQFPAKAGTTLALPILLSNDGTAPQVIQAICIPDLTGPAGKKIAAKQLQILPAGLVIPAASQAELLVNVRLPKTCKAGLYSGLLHDAVNHEVRVILVVEVS